MVASVLVFRHLCPFRRLHAFALIFKTKLHGTFDAELDDPTGGDVAASP